MVGGRSRLLTNAIYLGKVNHKGQIYAGEHPALVDEAIWQRVQGILRRNRAGGNPMIRNKYGALLRGLLRCVPCDCAMIHGFSTKGKSQYRYYVCASAQKRGWDTCPSKSVPAAEMEQFVVDQIRCVGRDPDLVAETLRQARIQAEERLKKLQDERRLLERELAGYYTELSRLAGTASADGDRLADLSEHVRLVERRLAELQDEAEAIKHRQVDDSELAAALAAFDPVWDALAPRERTRIVQLLVERVDYDGRDETVSMTFRATGVKTLAAELASHAEVKV